MPLSITSYCCNHCGMTYKTYSDALLCEARPIPVLEYPIGSSMRFRTETEMFGRYTYSYAEGTVLLPLVTLVGDEHVREYVVQIDKPFPYETTVRLMQDSSSSKPSWVSLANSSYKPGYAASIIAAMAADGITPC